MKVSALLYKYCINWISTVIFYLISIVCNRVMFDNYVLCDNSIYLKLNVVF